MSKDILLKKKGEKQIEPLLLLIKILQFKLLTRIIRIEFDNDAVKLDWIGGLTRCLFDDARSSSSSAQRK